MTEHGTCAVNTNTNVALCSLPVSVAEAPPADFSALRFTINAYQSWHDWAVPPGYTPFAPGVAGPVPQAPALTGLFAPQAPDLTGLGAAGQDLTRLSPEQAAKKTSGCPRTDWDRARSKSLSFPVTS